MTQETPLLTDSQEQTVMKALTIMEGQIDIEDFNLEFDGLPHDYSNEESELINNYRDDHHNILDDKFSLHQSIAMIPPVINPILGKEEFAGEYNFKLILNPQNNGKHWVYSEKLSKVFIHMEQVLPLQFQWTPPKDGLWLRATMIYKLDQHRSLPVIRCHNHMAPDNNSNKNIDLRKVKHVIRCLHNTSSYEEYPNGHLSVVTPLGTPEVGVNNVPMDFVFYCKNSCTSGMNRRPTEILFTLEDDRSVVLGRRKLEVRVCSCPKRDKEKEENEMDPSMSIGHGKKRKSTGLPLGLPPPGKKIVTNDTKVYTLNLNVVGKENAAAVIKYAYDVMAGSAAKTGNYEHYKPYMDDLSRKVL